MHEFIEASTRDIPTIQDIAEKTWWPTYSPILSEQQIRYMLDAIYSTETLTHVMLNGIQKFIFLKDENGVQGFASYGRRPEDQSVFKLHKIYILPANHGKGYGRLMIDEVKQRIRLAGSTVLDLNVNKFNPAKSFYEKLGFTVIAEEDIAIGPYWMNDYVMRLHLGA